MKNIIYILFPFEPVVSLEFLEPNVSKKKFKASVFKFKVYLMVEIIYISIVNMIKLKYKKGSIYDTESTREN